MLVKIFFTWLLLLFAILIYGLIGIDMGYSPRGVGVLMMLWSVIGLILGLVAIWGD